MGSNKLERNTNHGEEQAIEFVSLFCARIINTVINSQINRP